MNECDWCPVPGGRCILRESGRCNKAKHEAIRKLRNPHADTYWTDKAVAAACRPEPGHRIVIRGRFDSFSGYGQHITRMGQALESRGIPVALWPIEASDHLIPLDPWSRSRIVDDPEDRWVLMVSGPDNPAPPDRHVIYFSMWESSRLPANATEILSRSRLVIAPSQWVSDMFFDNGVTAPIIVAQHGSDANIFTPRYQSIWGPFTVGIAGRMSHGGTRKGIVEGIKGFLEAFPDDPDVRLRVKIWPDCPEVPTDDPRVDVCRDPLTLAGLADWYRGNHVFASWSCGEGFGMQPLQSMACGVPVIATNWSGHGEYLDESVGWVAGYDMVPATEFYEGLGRWAKPCKHSMIALMRHARRHPEEVAVKGRAARFRALEFTWDRQAEIVHRALIEAGALGGTIRPPECEESKGDKYGGPYTYTGTPKSQSAPCQGCRGKE